jgi:hypothetical protein
MADAKRCDKCGERLAVWVRVTIYPDGLVKERTIERGLCAQCTGALAACLGLTNSEAPSE